ncbi:hypothetical protein C0992_006302 [Termitomyces sp. T32_za158]|nr:hypothetical protein C0992_006302 [Termitomyces sp. T32_za158]
MKSRECSKVDPHVQRNFKKVIQVWQARVFVSEQRKLAAARETIEISAASLALLTSQEFGVVVENFHLVPSMPTRKGKAPAIPTPRKWRASTLGDKQLAKQSRSSMASWKGTKAVVRRQEETPPVVGPSQEIIPIDPVEKVLPLGSVVLSDPKEVSSNEAPSNHQSAVESSSSSSPESESEVPVFPLCTVQPNYAPLPTPRVNSQEFIWLRKVLNYPISALHPTSYIEAAKEKTEGIAEVMRKDI